MRSRPSSADVLRPGPDQESVWDYPRPPRLERSTRRVSVTHGGVTVAETDRAWRVLETSHPPSWYVPRADVDQSLLQPSSARATVCEWKGRATYWDVVISGRTAIEDQTVTGAAWSYEDPTPGFAELAGALSFMPNRFRCSVDGELVRAQDGGFYGGWVTDDVVGPFKGGPGTLGW
ncbi:MAG: DUF427 domain-containing protein [bacterium]